MATTKTLLLTTFVIALASACTAPEPTREQLEFRCNTGCGYLEELGCQPEGCYDDCVMTALDAEREGCMREAEAIMDCAEAQPDQVRCDPARTSAVCADEVNAFLDCQAAE
jgi:hypothetical protein